MESYLVEVKNHYFICEDKPTIKTNGYWQTDGMHVEIPHHVAMIFSGAQQVKLEPNCIIDLMKMDHLF